MKHIHLSINNYQYFSDIFVGSSEVALVTNNLKQAIARDVTTDETAHLNLQYWVHYDDEGFAGFEVNRAIFDKKTIYVNVEFISTVK